MCLFEIELKVDIVVSLIFQILVAITERWPSESLRQLSHGRGEFPPALLVALKSFLLNPFRGFFLIPWSVFIDVVVTVQELVDI